MQSGADPESKRVVDDRRPDLDSLFSVNPDGSHNVIHPADCKGRFTTYKRFGWPILIGIYVAMPWVTINGNPAILIDIPARHFFLFGNTYTAQDFWLAFFWVTGIAFTLFVVSALFGRLWCGYGCPQTVFLEGVYRRVERWFEGNDRKRRELDRAPWNGAKILRRGGKYATYAVISYGLAHTFLGYFMPAHTVCQAVLNPPSEHWVAFVFVMALTAVMFVNFTWFREQLCIVICPYGRLQGVLYDQHTINVGYDQVRGEPRGKSGGGDCIDCYRCVAVCPTGIDIRNGTQLECVGCANCIDACDEIMDKVGKPRGLVRYGSLAAFERQPTRFWRPRVALYAVLLLIGITVFAFAATSRTGFESRLLRLKSSPYSVENGVVVNPLSLVLENKSSEQRRLTITIEAAAGVEVIIPDREVDLAPLEHRRIPVFARVPVEDYVPKTVIPVRVASDEEVHDLELRLLGPPKAR